MAILETKIVIINFFIKFKHFAKVHSCFWLEFCRNQIMCKPPCKFHKLQLRTFRLILSSLYLGTVEASMKHECISFQASTASTNLLNDSSCRSRVWVTSRSPCWTWKKKKLQFTGEIHSGRWNLDESFDDVCSAGFTLIKRIEWHCHLLSNPFHLAASQLTAPDRSDSMTIPVQPGNPAIMSNIFIWTRYQHRFVVYTQGTDHDVLPRMFNHVECH